jgi:hypothetical protein
MKLAGGLDLREFVERLGSIKDLIGIQAKFHGYRQGRDK